MDRFADNLIDTLGGTRAVARFTAAPESSVSSWRKNLTASRLNHLKRVAQAEKIKVDWATGLRVGESQADRDAPEARAA